MKSHSGRALGYSKAAADEEVGRPSKEVEITVSIVAEYLGPWPGVGDAYNVLVPDSSGPGTTILVRPGIDDIEGKVRQVLREHGWKVT